MKILYLTNLAAPYRVDFFNELSHYCDLTVLFERKYAKDRNKDWYLEKFKFNYYFLKSIPIKNESSFSYEIIKYLKADYDLIILGGYSTLTAMLAAIYMRINKIHYILNADGGFIKKDEKKLIKKIKSFFISSPSFWLSSSKHTSDYLKYYGAKEERIYKFKFTSLKKEDILKEIIEEENKLRIRKELNISNNKMILSVGQIIDRKGFDILIKECRNIKNADVYIIGGKENEYLREIREKLKINNVHYIDFLNNEELEKYYMAADIFVFLTREDIWGLVVNEALARGLPTVSTSKCGAALELINGTNGLIVNLKEKDIGIKIEKFLENIGEAEAKNALNSVKTYTIDQMVIDHIYAFNEICKCLKSKCN